eukprot:6551454-Pyramimonas_sp.AAC.1
MGVAGAAKSTGEGSLRKSGTSKFKSNGSAAGSTSGADGRRGDRSRTPTPGEGSELDDYASLAFVHELANKMDRMEGGIKDSLKQSVTAAVRDST